MLWMWKQNTKQGRGKSYGSEKIILKMNDNGNSDHQSSIITLLSVQEDALTRS